VCITEKEEGGGTGTVHAYPPDIKKGLELSGLPPKKEEKSSNRIGKGGGPRPAEEKELPYRTSSLIYPWRNAHQKKGDPRQEKGKPSLRGKRHRHLVESNAKLPTDYSPG